MELLQTFEYGSLKVETYYQGTDILPNRVYINNKLALEDNTFRPSPLYNIDNTETMVSLLGFYTLQYGDVEDEYFETIAAPTILEWSESHIDADAIRTMCYDYELRLNKEFLKENEMTFEECSKIEQYIINA